MKIEGDPLNTQHRRRRLAVFIRDTVTNGGDAALLVTRNSSLQARQLYLLIEVAWSHCIERQGGCSGTDMA